MSATLSNDKILDQGALVDNPVKECYSVHYGQKTPTRSWDFLSIQSIRCNLINVIVKW